MYELLSVAPNASMEEVRRAARHLRAEVHPDRRGGALLPRAQEINAACDILCDERRRATYDAQRDGDWLATNGWDDGSKEGAAARDPFAGLLFARQQRWAGVGVDEPALDWSGLFR